MFCALILLAWNGPLQDRPKSLYEQVITHPDPYNGYDDYVRAADVVEDPEFSTYATFGAGTYARMVEDKKYATNPANLKQDPALEWTPEDEARLNLGKRLDALDYLGVRREMVARYGKALDYVRIGNGKPCREPESLKQATSFPALASFRSVVKLFVADAYVRSADGNRKGATADLIDGLTMSRRISGGSLISFLSGLACQSIMLAEAERSLPELSDADALQLIPYADKSLADRLLAKAFEGESEQLPKLLDEMLDPDELKGTGETEGSGLPPGFFEFARKLTPTQLADVKAKIIRLGKRRLAVEVERANSDESTWRDVKGDDREDIQKITTLDDFVEYLTDLTTPVARAVYPAALKGRAQLRLLGLHGRIIDFRWKHGRLPNTLREAVPERLCHDPMGNADFVYELTETGYKLYSKGLPSTGPVELKYRRPAGLPQDQEAIPPGSGPNPHSRSSRRVQIGTTGR